MVTQWSLVVLSFLTPVGVGVFIATSIGYLLRTEGGEIRPCSYILTAILLLSAVLIATFTIGNPTRIFNIFGAIKTGFSLAIVFSILLAVVSVYLFNISKTDGKHNIKSYILTIVGCLIGIVIIYAAIKINLKPSRVALNHWSLPVYIISLTVTSGVIAFKLIQKSLYAKMSKYFNSSLFIALVIQIIALSGFFINIARSVVDDRYISFERLTDGTFGLIFFICVIFIGIVLPFILQLYLFKKNNNTILNLLSFIFVLVGSVGFGVIINSSLK